MQYIKKYKFILIIIILIIILCLFYEKPTLASESIIYSETKEEVIDSVLEIKVDIKGAVKNPGVYTLKENSRIIDAINLSGGLNKNASVNTINLSKKLEDEMIIYIYTIEEINKISDIKIDKIIKFDIKGEVQTPGVYEIKENSRVIDAIKLAGGLTAKADVSKINLSKVITDEMLINIDKIIEIYEEIEITEDDTKISINKASKEELMTLTGIGEAKALKIIEYRENNPFTDINELTNVSGISESIYEKIKDSIRL